MQRDGDFKITLKDNSNIILVRSKFNTVIENYSRCAYFYVKLKLEAEIMPEIVATPDVSCRIFSAAGRKVFHDFIVIFLGHRKLPH